MFAITNLHIQSYLGFYNFDIGQLLQSYHVSSLNDSNHRWRFASSCSRFEYDNIKHHTDVEMRLSDRTLLTNSLLLFMHKGPCPICS